MGKFRVFEYVYRPDLGGVGINGRKKKHPNQFILFSKKLRENAPKELRIKASELNKFASYLWKEKMTDAQKEFWRKRSQKDRLTPSDKELTDYIQNAAISYVDLSYVSQLNDCSFKEFTTTRLVLKSDCYLTDSLELNWSIHI
ncbi:hypothetical protein RclHR1_00220039 [Rhizophagus clarus]|uniref:Uncharacterized protein n=1 Tax=Rhizophagus clarus TaxID=94130 RepID=A0A2Z6QVH0_9GLOM|nr:hypothetical protein RclHR1_00220039 [Rhizophagus clarus]GES84582.1 hypothetical protein GLOIN_2v1784656 [Rhizophagus clarus]